MNSRWFVAAIAANSMGLGLLFYLYWEAWGSEGFPVALVGIMSVILLNAVRQAFSKESQKELVPSRLVGRIRTACCVGPIGQAIATILGPHSGGPVAIYVTLAQSILLLWVLKSLNSKDD